jgi:Ca-activated chloride channel family protein
MALLILLYAQMARGRQQKLNKFAAPHLVGKLCCNVSTTRRTAKRVLLIIAIACCFVALARPQYGFKWVEVKRKGIDILFAVDTSKSMLVQDVQPNRLKRAKFAIMDFVGQLEGDRVGLMPFAGAAFLMCPMTIDYSAFENSLTMLDTSIIPRGGTDFATAIREAGAILSNEANYKILVLITDGENLQGDALDAAEEAAQKGMVIYTVGVGTSEGELIPLNRKGRSGFVKDESGNFVTSQLDEGMLTRIAEATGGLYVPLGQNAQGLETIYQEKLSLIPKEEVAEKRHKIALERFVWPLAAAIAFLLLEFLVGGRKSSRSLRIPFIKTAGRRKKKEALLSLLLLCSLGVAVSGARASEGVENYGAGDFLGASEFFSQQLELHPDDARLHYNYGTAAYKNNMFEEAAKAFTEALKTDDLALQQEAYYNRGNAQFQRGKETLQADAEHTITLWEQAVASYEGALELDSMNEDARFNLEQVKRQLEELKKQQEEKQKQKQKQDKQQDKQKQDEQQDKQQDKQQKQDDQSSEDKSKNEGQQDEEQPSGESGKSGDDKASSQEQPGKEPGDQDSQPDKGTPSGQDEEQDTPQEANEASPNDAAEKAAEQAAQARDMVRRAQGKMTRDEARQLLNSLRDETGELNFIPSAAQGEAQGQTVGRDW